MKDSLGSTFSTSLLLGLCLLLVSCSDMKKNSNTALAARDENQSQTPAGVESERKQAEKQARPEVEQQRKQSEEDAKKELDQDAQAAISQTRKAFDAITQDKTDEAISAIEQATGKINVLLARNPSTALIPVDLAVELIDTAPQDTQAILEIGQDASRALDDKNYPTARALLYRLMSEIRVRTFNLPLATYRDALKEAARLLDQKQPDQAKNVLLTALNTLLIVDRVTPLPLLLARDAINQAQAKSQQDKNAAQALLETAKSQAERAREPGYAGKDQEYAALNNQISTLEKQLRGNGDLTAAFSKLKDKLGASLQGLHLVVSDIEIARRTLVQRGIAVSGVFHDEGGVFHHPDLHHLTSGPYPERKSFASYASFSDPDGNSWALQEVTPDYSAR